jgi:hypothetical protein
LAVRYWLTGLLTLVCHRAGAAALGPSASAVLALASEPSPRKFITQMRCEAA